MSDNKEFGIIIEHVHLSSAFDFYDDYKDSKFVTNFMFVGGLPEAGGMIKSNLIWDEKNRIYTGKTYATNQRLRGIRILNMPTLTLVPDTKTILVTMQMGNQKFSQSLNASTPEGVRKARVFSHHFVEVIGRRVNLAIRKHEGLDYSRWCKLSLEFLQQLLKDGKVVEKYRVRTITYELVKEVRQEELTYIDEVKNNGLLIKCTNSYFNGGLKEEIEYYVVEATGEFWTYPGSNPDFRFPDRVGYVDMLLTQAPLK